MLPQNVSPGDPTDNMLGVFLSELSEVYPGKRFFRMNGERINQYAMKNSTCLYRVTQLQEDSVWVTPVEVDPPVGKKEDPDW